MGPDAQKSSPQPPETSQPKYAAFISYRHLPRDAEVAQYVQRAIERYRLPSDLVAADGQRSLGLCFRDEDELAATHSLPGSIKSALARSKALIVICTPNTRDSVWVQREIEEYLRIHGHEHIIAVLAAGSSAESIPAVLRSRSVEVNGVAQAVPAEPLAADLRSSSRSKRRTGVLRVIAALAGCSYGDLVKRDRVRRRKRIVLGMIVAALLAALVAALSVNACSANHEALIAQSKALAAESKEQFAHGERIDAIRTALEALPVSEADVSRPLVPEAREALEEALLISRSEVWSPLFAIDAPDEIVQFEIDGEIPLIAVRDETNRVSIYSSVTGSFYLTVDLADYAGEFAQLPASQWKMLSLPSGGFLLGCTEPGAPLLCFEGAMGHLEWKLDDFSVNSLAISESKEAIGTFCFRDGEGLEACFLDCKNGDVIERVLYERSDMTASKSWYEACFDDTERALYVNVNGAMYRIGSDQEGPVFLQSVGEYAFGIIDSSDGALVIGGYDIEGDVEIKAEESDETDSVKDFFSASSSYPGVRASYAFIAWREGDALWGCHGEYTSLVIDASTQTVTQVGMPAFRGFSHAISEAVVVTAGSTLAVCDLATGDELLLEHFPSPIAGLDVIPTDERDLLFGVLENGTIFIREVSSAEKLLSRSLIGEQDIAYDASQARFWNEGGIPRLLVHPVGYPNRLVGYAAVLPSQEESSELSLDELLEKGRDTVERDERFEFNGVLHPM